MHRWQYADLVTSLAEMASRLFQQRVWIESSTEWMSSCVECVTRIFDESGLQEALRAGVVFGEDVDSLLREMDALTDENDFNLPPGVLVDDPKFRRCSRIAQDVLPFVILRSGITKVES